jgi:PAS domain S-box-containing protein
MKNKDDPLLSAPILGQLLLMQSLLSNLPDENSIFSFVCRGLTDVPGVVEVNYFKEIHASSDPSFISFPLQVGNSTKGHLLFKISDLTAFKPYIDYLKNFCFMLTVILGERDQRREIELYQSQLEERIQERTKQLSEEISERRRTEEALSQSEIKFRTVFENSVDAIGVSKRGVHVFANPAYLALFGYADNDELVGKSVLDFIAPDQRGQIAQNVLARANGEAVLSFYETRGLRKDGTQFEAEVHVSTYEYLGEIFTLVILRDITEHNLADLELQKYREHLEELVQERTASLEVVNQELESFSYSVSHDLRAPLRAIDGFSKIILEDYNDKLGAEGRDNLIRIRTASQHMGQLIDDILQLSRVSRVDMNMEMVDLSALVRSISNTLQQSLPDRQVKFMIEDGITVKGDRHLLTIALENLISNAWKFSAKQTLAKIEFGTLVRNGAVVYFLRDNGVGFNMQYIQKLFIPFQRLHSEKEFPGTGVGLSTVQRIIRRHGGTIWAESEAGKGATFLFTL